MQAGRRSLRLAASAGRVSSPSAAKTAAWLCRLAPTPLRSLCDIALDVFQLLSPAVVIHAKRFQTALARNLVEARLRHHQQRALRALLQRELDERRSLLRIINLGIDPITMPDLGKKPFGLDLFP